MFDEKAIRAAIQEDLSTDITIPADHRGALVTFINTDKVEVALATRLTDRWFVELIAEHQWTGDNVAGVISKMTW